MTPEEEMRKILAEQGALRKKLLRLEMRVAELSDRTSADEDLELEPNPQERADSDTLSALSKAKLRRDGASGTPEMKGGGVASGKSDAENLEDEADDLAENLVPATLGSSWNVSEPETKELEIKLGSYWFVRIGIFMLLTGFVFLANYARVSVHDPLAKVGLLYGLAFGLLCAGLWLERRREEVRNFGRVLAAGGVAAVYYTTYAAYKVEALSVITSPYVAGLLLLVWTTVMIIVSHRKHSQTLALMGILLAYFTCVILDRATMFSLFSALLLACAGIVLLIVSRWVVVGFVSLGGTYLTFIYWRFPEVNTWLLGGAPDSTHFWPAQALLAGYWLLFTVATFATGREVLDGDKRSAFATVNNAAFLALFALGMHLHFPDSLGLFLLVAGVVFFGLSELAKRRFVQSGELYLGYQVAGVVAVAAGALFHFSGYALALVLSTASLVFLWFGKARRSDFLNASAYLLAAVGTIAAIPAGTEGLSWLAGFAQVGMLIMGGWYIRKWRENDQPRSRVPESAAAFVLFGIACAYFGPIMDLPAAWQPVVLAVCAVAASCCLHFLKFHELALGGLLLAVVAGARYPWLAVKTEVWAGVVVWLALAYLAFWVSREKRIEVSAETSAMRFVLRDLLSVGAVVSLGFWLHRVFEVPATWLWMGGITATILLGLGMSMRLPMLAIGAQGFHLVAFYFFPKYLEQESALLMIAPIVFVLASIVVSRQFEDAVPAEDPIDTMWRNFLAGAMFLFRVAAVILFSAWVGHFVDAAWQSPLIGAVALVMGVSAILGGNRSRFVFALIVFALALLQWTRDLFDAPPYDWPNALVCLVPVVLAELIRRTEGKSRPGSTFLGEESGAARVVLVSLAVIMAWRTASVFAGETFGGFYLTISWALLAFVVFGMGFGLQEKTYRWLGLLVLGFAVARILLIDVWRLEPLPRILSFVAIGMVLVTLGFVYNRYQEFIRRYL